MQPYHPSNNINQSYTSKIQPVKINNNNNNNFNLNPSPSASQAQTYPSAKEFYDFNNIINGLGLKLEQKNKECKELYRANQTLAEKSKKTVKENKNLKTTNSKLITLVENLRAENGKQKSDIVNSQNEIAYLKSLLYSSSIQPTQTKSQEPAPLKRTYDEIKEVNELSSELLKKTKTEDPDITELFLVEEEEEEDVREKFDLNSYMTNSNTRTYFGEIAKMNLSQLQNVSLQPSRKSAFSAYKK